jgi:NADH-quinone oxidoreductase subunit J
MPISPTLFMFFAGLAIVSSLFVVLKKNPVSNAFSLVVVMLSFAAIYAMLGAHLMAGLQVLVYAGAVMVLFVFVIMLLNADVPSFDLGRTGKLTRIFASVLTVAVIGVFVWVFKTTPSSAIKGPFTLDAIENAGGNTRVLSELMFSSYILPFELTSILLLAAIVGAVAIAMRKKKDAPKGM